MRNGLFVSLTALTIMAGAFSGSAFAQQKGAPPPPPMRLTSPAFNDSTMIPIENSCSAQPAGVTPELHWSEVPNGTASFALILHDLEPLRQKQSREDIVHWIAWNIPGSARQLPKGIDATPQLPDGTRQGKSVRGTVGFTPPCPPPPMNHHYVFELYALDQTLNLEAGATRPDLLNAMDGHIIGHAVLVGLFHR
jgi:Raf kinase inhibitor-like YbhB/YbcL family protein